MVPVVPPNANAPVSLSEGQLFVIDSDVQLIVLSSPAGILSSTADSGPVKIRGVFVDAPGKTSTRTFKGPFVYTVDVLATGRAELLIVPVGANVKQLTEDNVVRRTIDANLGPKPPPVVPPVVPPVTPTIPLTPFQLQLQSKLTTDAATADQVTKYAAFYTVSAKQAQNTAFAASNGRPAGRGHEE